MGDTTTVAELVARVREKYSGAREAFIMARLTLRTGFDVRSLSPDDNDPGKAKKLREAIREVCKDLHL